MVSRLLSSVIQRKNTLYFFSNSERNLIMRLFGSKLLHVSMLAAVSKIFFVSFFYVTASIAASSSAKPDLEERPDWWGNRIGKDEIVLPSFDPIRVEGKNIILGAGRKYQWDKSVLADQVLINDKLFVAHQALVLVINGVSHELMSSDFRIVEYGGHHVEVIASGAISSLLDFKVITRVEYDGVAMVELVFAPRAPLQIDSFHYTATTLDSEWTDVLGFNHNDLGNRKKKVVLELPYEGPLLSTTAFLNGEEGFWWFIDESKGWSHKLPEKATKIERSNQQIVITQAIVDSSYEFNEERRFQFNYLATPVKKVIGNTRTNRVARGKTKSEGVYHGQSLWWIDAFSHQVLPYTNFSKIYPDKIDKFDQSVYPGLAQNKRVQAEFKRSGILRLPYFSAHVLNHLDPAYQQHQHLWEIKPKIVWDKFKYDGPFQSMRNDVFLTHRAEGYTDYLLYRFDQLISELGIEGLYFDQGGVRLTKSLLNGGWIDEAEALQGATDILALRDFHKRLATLFYLRGKKGLIVSHNSNTMIAPAYTFTTAMVQGEEFNHWLTDYDYIGSVGIDEVRSRYGARSIGVPTLWLEVIFAQNSRLKKSGRPLGMSDKGAWHNSIYYEQAYLNFMTLALLHDMPTWSYAPIPLRNKIMKKIDWVEPEFSEFFGYWLREKEEFSQDLFFSYYLNKGAGKALFIISNLTAEVKSQSYNQLTAIMLEEHFLDCQIQGKNKENQTDSVSVAAKRFVLLPLQCDQAANAN